MKNQFIISNDGEVLCKCSQNAEGIVKIPEGIIAIRQNAFKRCKNITDIKFSTTLRKIGSSAFEGCCSLRSVKIPYGVNYLGERVFFGCSQVVSIIIPSSVTELPYGAFENNYALRYIKLPETGLKNIEDNCFRRNISLKKVVIPHCVTSIGRAFSECWKLEKVIMRAQGVSISKTAFVGCPDGLTVDCVVKPNFYFSHINMRRIIKTEHRIISAEEFAGKLLWPYTTSFNASPKYVDKIGKGAFLNCTGLLGFCIPKSVSIIEEKTFSGCNRLSKVKIENGVQKICQNAFENCSDLTNLYLPDSLEEIEDHAFTGCKSLIEVSMSKNTKIAATAFDENEKRKITFRD